MEKRDKESVNRKEGIQSKYKGTGNEESKESERKEGKMDGTVNNGRGGGGRRGTTEFSYMLQREVITIN